MRAKNSRWAPSSTMAMFCGTLISRALASAAARMARAPSSVRRTLLRVSMSPLLGSQPGNAREFGSRGCPNLDFVRFRCFLGAPRQSPQSPGGRPELYRDSPSGNHMTHAQGTTKLLAMPDLPKFEPRYDVSRREHEMKNRTGIRRLTDTCALPAGFLGGAQANKALRSKRKSGSSGRVKI
jgi:hypothetical protein